MSDYEEATLNVQGVNVRVRKGGSGSPLVYLHGAGGGGKWHEHHALLAEHFTVYAPDHPGWSDSDAPEWMDSMLDYTLHYDALFRMLDIQRPALVGHSLGGWMAAAFACVYPTRLSRLALVNAAGYPHCAEEQPDFFAVAMRGGAKFSEALFHDPEIAKTYMPANPTPEERMLRFRHMTSTARLAWHCWYDEKSPQRLARLEVPTLVLWGAHDGLFPPVLAEKYAADIPNSRLVILPNCAHMVPYEDPNALVREILELPEAPL